MPPSYRCTCVFMRGGTSRSRLTRSSAGRDITVRYHYLFCIFFHKSFCFSSSRLLTMSWLFLSTLKDVCLTVPLPILAPVVILTQFIFSQHKCIIMVLLLLIYTVVLSLISDEGKRSTQLRCKESLSCFDEYTNPMRSSCILVFVVGFLLVYIIVRCAAICISNSDSGFHTYSFFLHARVVGLIQSLRVQLCSYYTLCAFSFPFSSRMWTIIPSHGLLVYGNPSSFVYGDGYAGRVSLVPKLIQSHLFLNSLRLSHSQRHFPR